VSGATIVTVVLTLEDVCVTVEPFRKGVPEIGMGT
jgi:cation:H+ antiporter